MDNDTTPALAREDRAEDQHVMPTYGQEHDSSCWCWCVPTCDPVAAPGGGAARGRIWLHREDN